MKHKFIKKTYKESQCSFCGLKRVAPQKSHTFYIWEDIYLILKPPCQDLNQGNIFNGYREDTILPEPKKALRKEKPNLYEPGIANPDGKGNSTEGQYTSIEILIKDCREIFDVIEVIYIPAKETL